MDGRDDVAKALSSSAAAASHAAWKRHVLLQLLPSTQTLLAHLTSLSSMLSEAHLLRAGDSDDYARLLRSTLLAAFAPFTGRPPRSHPWIPSPPTLLHERISAILLHASTRSISRVAARPFVSPSSSASSRFSLSAVQPLPLSPSFAELPSVLSLGYRRVRQDSGSALIDHPTVEAFEINSAVTLIQQSRDWLLLLDRVGDEVMAHLLNHCFVFVPLLHASFMQVAGPVLTEAFRIARQRAQPPPPSSTIAPPAPQRMPQPGTRPLKRAHSDLGSGEVTGATGSPLKRTRTDYHSLASVGGVMREVPAAPAPSITVPSAASPAAAATRPVLPACLLGQVIPRSSLFFHYPARIRCGLPTHRQPPHHLTPTPPTPTPTPAPPSSHSHPSIFPSSSHRPSQHPQRQQA